MSAVQVLVQGVGLLGPGLTDWASAQPLLRDPATWTCAATLVPAPQRLPATERRRAGTVVKASIVVADQALQGSEVDPADLATVFTSSTGDPLNCHLLCEALAQPQRLMSPTRFTNSVHNAAAGYWHISTHSSAASTSLAAFDASFAAGLLEAAVQCAVQQQDVLLVACDVPYPEPLHSVRPVADIFAVALLLQPTTGEGQSGRLLTLQTVAQGAPQHYPLDEVAAMVETIPAARALPLLQALAGNAACSLRLPGLPGMDLQLELAAQHAQGLQDDPHKPPVKASCEPRGSTS